MCGIIGYTGNRNAIEIITDGLNMLEYRGYDSAGLSVFSENSLITVKTAGRVSELRAQTANLTDREIFCGIGHTRWATHGKPDEKNCHPHGTNNVMIVHNGIIENYKELKSLFPDNSFISETDTEVAARLIDREYKNNNDPITAIRNTANLLKGSFALAIVFADITNTVFATKHDSPILVGLGKNENYIASDASAFSSHTNTFIRLNDGDIAEITPSAVTVYDQTGQKIERNRITTESDGGNYFSETYEHHMLREISETPEKMKLTFDSLTKNFLPCFGKEFFDKKTDCIHIIGCGTALHAGLAGKYFIEKLARIPVRAASASEFRYSDPIISENDAAVVISQSGETADTLAALRMLNKNGTNTVAVVNAHGSSIANEARSSIFTLAGKEIAVASTKAFSVQCQVFLILAVKLALLNNKISENQATEILLSHSDSFTRCIPLLLNRETEFINAAEFLKNKKTAFFIGRGIDDILGKEGSLKLKEISYIHSESLPAGEFKHGTISLIEKNTPVIAVATEKKLYEKMRSNILEVKARGAFVISVCPDDADIISDVSDYSIKIPDNNDFSLPFTATVALQLLAYYTARAMGRDIDKPRNLAKSVTVE